MKGAQAWNFVAVPVAPREAFPWSSSQLSLQLASRFLVDCVHFHIEGRSRFVGSWGFLIWEHPAFGTNDWPGFFEGAFRTNELEDLILILAAQVLEALKVVAVSGLTLRRGLHKAGHWEHAGTSLWWKACQSAREDSVAQGAGDIRLARAYLGGCPFMPDSYEVVFICEDEWFAAVLAALPRFIRDVGAAEKRNFSEPTVSCSIWEDDPEKRMFAVSNLSARISDVTAGIAALRSDLWNFGTGVQQ